MADCLLDGGGGLYAPPGSKRSFPLIFSKSKRKRLKIKYVASLLIFQILLLFWDHSSDANVWEYALFCCLEHAQEAHYRPKVDKCTKHCPFIGVFDRETLIL